MKNVDATLAQWETVIRSKHDGSYDLQRFKVPGGWLVRTFGEREPSMCFMPDGSHRWSIPKG